MGAAEVISFEEVRASKQWSTLRHQLHERFDQWLDTLEQVWHEPPATLSEVTATVWDLRHSSPEASRRRSWRMPTRVNASAHRPAVRGVRVCSRCKLKSGARSRRWWGRLSCSDPIRSIYRTL